VGLVCLIVILLLPVIRHSAIASDFEEEVRLPESAMTWEWVRRTDATVHVFENPQ
jgi:hypothetical protein